jgi:hypothetical protein
MMQATTVYLFIFSWRNVDIGRVITRSFYISVRNAASSLPIQGILISSSKHGSASVYVQLFLLTWLRIRILSQVYLTALLLTKPVSHCYRYLHTAVANVAYPRVLDPDPYLECGSGPRSRTSKLTKMLK